MKWFIINFSLATLCVLMFAGLLAAQDEIKFERKSMRMAALDKNENITSSIVTRPSTLTKIDDRQNAIPSLSKYISGSMLEVIDTLNYPLAGTKALYTADDGGYVTGNNLYGDLAKANYYATNSTISLTGVLFDFAIAVGGDPTIEIAIWDNSGLNNSPGSIISSHTINLNEIKNDVLNEQMTFISFDTPVLLTTSFYAGFVLPTVVGDTLAVYSNTDGDTNPGIAWEMWSDGTWLPINSNDTWSRDIAMSVFPIIVGSSQIETDTLNFPLAGGYVYYYLEGGGGYQTGNNMFGDLAKANFFQNDQNMFITGVLMEFAVATGGNPNIELALWDNSGANGSPGAKIGSQYVSLNTIKNQINNQQLTYVAFNPPVSVSASFFAGFMLPTTADDTLVVWSNTDGDTNPSTAWELWESNQWYSFNHPDSWGLNIALAVFPIVQNTLGMDENNTEDLIKVFPNPSNGFFSIFSEMFNDEQAILSIHRIDGTLINTRAFRNTDLLSFDLSNEPAGIYFLTFETDSKYIIKKLLKR